MSVLELQFSELTPERLEEEEFDLAKRIINSGIREDARFVEVARACLERIASANQQREALRLL